MRCTNAPRPTRRGRQASRRGSPGTSTAAIRDTRSHRSTRNDRLVAVADKSHRHAHCRALRDLGDGMLQEMERFFVFYNAQKGVRFMPLGRVGVAAARRLVAEGGAARA